MLTEKYDAVYTNVYTNNNTHQLTSTTDLFADCGDRQPDTNRGFSSHTLTNKECEAWIDWQQCRITGALDQFIELIKGFTSGIPSISEESIHCGCKWDNYATFTCGTRFYFNYLDKDNGLIDGLLVVTGNALTRLSMRGGWRLLNCLRLGYNARFTRFDAKVRVPQNLFEYSDLHEVRETGNYSGFRNPPSCNISAEWVAKRLYKSETHYFGSRQSDSMTRIYDPFIKHLVLDCYDIEVELKDEKANQAVDILCSLPKGCTDQEIHQCLVDIVLGQIDFIDRDKGDRNLSRCPRLPWWQRVLDFCQSSPKKIKVGKYVPSIERSRKWFERQCAGFVAGYKKHLGSERFWAWFHELIAQKTENLPKHWVALSQEIPLHPCNEF